MIPDSRFSGYRKPVQKKNPFIAKMSGHQKAWKVKFTPQEINASMR